MSRRHRHGRRSRLASGEYPVVRELIVKIQLPLRGTEALVYDRERTVHQHLPISQDLAQAMAGRPKVFFASTIDAGGLLTLQQEVSDPGW